MRLGRDACTNEASVGRRHMYSYKRPKDRHSPVVVTKFGGFLRDFVGGISQTHDGMLVVFRPVTMRTTGG